MSGDAIQSVLQEDRQFPPPEAFSADAHISSEEQYQEMWQRAKDDPDGFWGELARENLDWFEPFEQVSEGAMPDTKWFTGGKLNVTHNCLDRHLENWRKNKAAIIWEGEPGDTRVLRYQDLHREVCRFANVLKQLGIEAGDRVTLYMPMVPELAIAMLACARMVRSTRSSSEDSVPTRWPRETTTPRPSWSSPPTPAGDVARNCR